ncbi:MAG: hypothetical protein E7349_02910 [Clostridiales bacterium]|nr:hypothetical protein [Clostridiales bacterium]
MIKIKKEEKKYTIEQAFCAVPSLYYYFDRIDTYIENYDGIINHSLSKEEWIEMKVAFTKEELQTKRNELAYTFQNLNEVDLEVIFYLHNLRGFTSRNLRKMLSDLYQKQIELENKYANGTKSDIVRAHKLKI